MWAVYLEPRSALNTELRSDTLFGILAWAVRMLEGETVLLRWLGLFGSGQPPFVISSAMPWLKQTDGKIMRFYPRPKFWQPSVSFKSATEYASFKAWKKRAWLDEATFLRVVRGERLQREHLSRLPDPPRSFKESVMHNALDRLHWSTSGEGRLFYREETFHQPSSGLFFLVDIFEKGVAESLRGALHLLEHVGFGADTTSGKGQMSVRLVEDFDPPWRDVDGANGFVTLSLYHPTEDERRQIAERVEQCWYELSWRRGKVGGRFYKTGHFWKKALTFFSEGSTFPKFQDGPYGNAPVVKEQESNSSASFRVRTYGYSFPVSARVEEIAP